MEFVTGNWGGLVSVVGLVVSVVGLGCAIKEARGARSASQAAQSAAGETRDHIARHLQTVDLERAIGLIQRIKLLHDIDWWEAAVEQYQMLRAMLSDIIARCPDGHTEHRQRLNTARMRVRGMENLVREHINQSIGDTERANLNRELNEIQSDLEELASGLGFGDPQGGGAMNELDDILEGLVQRTTDGKLQWKRTVAENEFVTSVDAIGIAVRELGQNSLGFPLRRQLEIADENGATVEVIETGGGMVGVQHDQRQIDQRARQLKQLYEMARRSALDTQATLEKLVKALGAE